MYETTFALPSVSRLNIAIIFWLSTIFLNVYESFSWKIICNCWITGFRDLLILEKKTFSLVYVGGEVFLFWNYISWFSFCKQYLYTFKLFWRRVLRCFRTFDVIWFNGTLIIYFLQFTNSLKLYEYKTRLICKQYNYASKYLFPVNFTYFFIAKFVFMVGMYA